MKMSTILLVALVVAFDASAANVTVRDENITGEVCVGNGETLSVYGNGLGADATLVLDGGSTVKFFANATISCPIIATNNHVVYSLATVKFQTSSASVTGTVAGVIDSARMNRLYMNASGMVILAGGGNIMNFYSDTGHCDVTGEYNVYGTQLFYGGHVKIRDGGKMSVKNDSQYLRMDKTESGKSAILEVAQGGVFEKAGSNEWTFLGTGDATKPSKILVTGGKFKHDSVRFNFRAGGSIEVVSGTFETHAPIRCWDDATPENAKILLKDGTMQFLGGSAGYCPSMFTAPVATDNQTGIGQCSFTIDGSARLILGYQPKMPDSSDNTAWAAWKCTPGSRLKVFGSGYEVTSVWHGFEADGLAFDLNVPTGQGLNKSVIAIADRTDTVGLGFVLPGTAGCRIITTNTTPAIAASYVVPSGKTLDVASLPDWWYDGFSSSSVSNITFDANSTLEFPFFPGSPLSIAGTLSLPSAMNFRVNAGGGPVRAAAPTTIVDPALGVDDAETCVWTCLGSTKEVKRSTMSVTNDRLCYAYEQPGTMVFIK